MTQDSRMGLRAEGGISGGLHKLKLEPSVRLGESSMRALSTLDPHQKELINCMEILKHYFRLWEFDLSLFRLGAWLKNALKGGKVMKE